jgi:hypothetical protein
VITKPEQHETNRAGKRLLREVLEPLGWVVNDVQEDYGIDSYVQIFDGSSPTGAWFHVQLKSSASSDYSADRTFVSQELLTDHARHYALEMRQPVFLIHADTTARKVYWYAPQLDQRLAMVLRQTGARLITVRIPTRQELPGTAPELLTSLNDAHLLLSTRELTAAPTESFAESLKHFPDQEPLYRAFQEKNDTLKLRRIRDLFVERKLDEAKPRAQALLTDPDSAIEIKFWAQIQLEAIDYAKTIHAGRPQNEIPKLLLANAKALQKLTKSGPKYLKFFSIISRRAAELEGLAHENFGLYMTLQQHLEGGGQPMMVLGLYAKRSEITRRIVFKYNQCLRLVRYAANYPDRWVLGRALTRVVNGIGRYLVTLRSENQLEAEQAFAKSALQICKLAVWICSETGDPEGVVMVIISALLTTQSENSDAYRWASSLAESVVDPELRADALRRLERAKRRWHGEAVDGDYQGDPIWQAIQNMATALGIDVTDESNPLVRGLKVAAKDNTPERVLVQCEHLLVSQGATGPVARRIGQLFNITTAGSKVVHCTLHDFHLEAKDQDTAYAEFKRAHCDNCPDQKPRPDGWQYTEEERQRIQAKHRPLVARLAGTPFGLRYTNED